MSLNDTAPRRWAWAVLALAAVGLSPAARSAAAERIRPPGLTVAAPVTPSGSGSHHSYSSSSVVVDPKRPLRVYAAAAELSTRRCVFFRSRDGGRTWTKPAASPSSASFPFCTHTRQFRPMTSLAMGRDNAIYYLHQGWAHQDQGEVATTSVLLARSADGGDSWSVAPVHDARRLAAGDQVNFPMDIVVDTVSPGGDVVYVSWTATYPGSIPARPAQPMIAVSLDAGRSFSGPVNATGAFFDDPANVAGDIRPALKRREHFGGEGPELALDRDGDLYVAWVRTSEALDPAPPHPRYLSRSSDRGKTFTVTQLAPPSHFAGPAPVLEWSSEGGPQGTLHAVYEDKVVPDQGDRDVLHRRSTDRGATWSEARVLNDDEPGRLFAQLLPDVAVAPNGRVDVVWWDQRDGAERYAVDVYTTSSSDGGATWSANVRLTDRSIERRAGSWVDHHGDTRQAPATASAPGVAHVVWDDTRHGGGHQGRQSLYAASVQYETLPRAGSGPSGAYALTGVGGLAAGAVVVAVGASRRRRLRQRRA